MSEYMLHVHVKSVTWNNKSGGKCERFSEKYLKCGRSYKTIWIPLLYHKYRKLPTNTGELEYMAWDVTWNIFFTLIFHTVKKAFVIFLNNPFHCRYKELIIFVIVYFLLLCLPYPVFLCVCKVNFEEIVLHSMMLNL